MTEHEVGGHASTDATINDLPPLPEWLTQAAVETHADHTEGGMLTSTDPEPPAGTIVRDDCGTLWQNDGPRYRPACWTQPDAEDHDPET